MEDVGAVAAEQGVRAAVSIEPVVARATIEIIVAVACVRYAGIVAVEKVVTGVAEERVGIGLADELVVAGTAVEVVVALAAREYVIATFTEDGVGTFTCDDEVATVEIRVLRVTRNAQAQRKRARGSTTRCAAGGGEGRRCGGTAGAGIPLTGVAEDHVIARPRIDEVGAAAAANFLRAHCAEDRCPGQRCEWRKRVEGVPPDLRQDCGAKIEQRVLAGGRKSSGHIPGQRVRESDDAQVLHDIRIDVGTEIRNEVAPGPTVRVVLARTQYDDVGAAATFDPVGPEISSEPLVATSAKQPIVARAACEKVAAHGGVNERTAGAGCQERLVDDGAVDAVGGDRLRLLQFREVDAKFPVVMILDHDTRTARQGDRERRILCGDDGRIFQENVTVPLL